MPPCASPRGTIAVSGLLIALAVGLAAALFGDDFFTGQWLFIGATEDDKGMPLSTVSGLRHRRLCRRPSARCSPSSSRWRKTPDGSASGDHHSARWVAAAVYLMLSGHMFRFILGLVLISNAANLTIFTAGRLTEGGARAHRGWVPRAPGGLVANPLATGAGADRHRHRLRPLGLHRSPSYKRAWTTPAPSRPTRCGLAEPREEKK